MSVDITFVRWHNSLASELATKGHRLGDKLFLNANPKIPEAFKQSSRGVYAIFDGIFFGIYRTPTDQELKLSVCIGGDLFDVCPASVIKHKVSLQKTTFSICSENTQAAVFSYRKLSWILLHGSMAEKADYFFDDWWGLTCDLPGWIESTFRNLGIEALASGIDAVYATVRPDFETE